MNEDASWPELHVELHPTGPLTEARVRETVALARDVARWNRNRTWNRKIACISHDVEVVTRFLPEWWPRRHVDKSIKKSVGSTWDVTTGAVIWVMPRVCDSEEVTTLCHEVAHALTVGAHGWTWRRMHLMLLPLVYKIFNMEIKDITWFALAVTRELVAQYRRHPYDDYEHAGRVFTNEARIEISKHVAAVERCWAKFGAI